MEINNFQHFFKECDKQRTPDHFNFYREVKFSKNLSFEGRMHIYEFVMHMLQHLGLSKTVELGACNDLFSPYFEKGGFSKTFGMFFITLRHDQSLFIKSIFKPQRLKRALVDWVVNGDFHTYIIDMIYEHPYKSYFEESLRKLECRIIRNSLIAGIKDESFWKSCYIMPKLIISEEDLNNLLISVTTSSNDDQKDSENQVCDLIPSEENMDTTSYYQQFDSEKTDEECKNDNTSSLNTNSTINIFVYNNYHFIYYIFDFFTNNFVTNNNVTNNNVTNNNVTNNNVTNNNVTNNNVTNNKHVKKYRVKKYRVKKVRVKKVKYYYQNDKKNVSANKEQQNSKDSINTENTEQTSPYSLQQELGMVNERFEDASITIKFEEMISYNPINNEGPDLNKLYDFLVRYMVIDKMDYETFEKCISHAYFFPMYKDGVKVNILYTIRKLMDFYPESWLRAVCENINVTRKRITQKMPCEEIFINFPSLNFKK